MSRKGNHLINNDDIQNKIAHLLTINKSRREFVASNLYPNEASFILEQIICQRKAIEKLPVFYSTQCLYTQKSLEQATSEKVAQWKAQFITAATTHPNCLCLTGGLGVDDYFLSNYFKNITSLDIDSELNEIVEYNLNQLSVKNIKRIELSCEEYLKLNSVSNSVIYIDPDRRPALISNNKNVSQFAPNILTIVPDLINNRNSVFIKLSGATDIDWIVNNLSNLKEIIVVSENHEVKEIFIHLEPNYNKTYNLSAVELGNSENLICYDEPTISQLKSQLNGSKYIFRPYSEIVKTNLLRDHKISISPNTYFFLTDDVSLTQFGTLYEVKQNVQLSLKKIKAFLNKHSITEASVISRNSKLNSAQTKKFLNLGESDNTWVFTLGKGKTNQFILGEKVI